MTERTIFLEALEITDPATRAAYLDSACAGNADLRREVDALLEAHGRDDGFLNVPVVNQVGAPPDSTITDNQVNQLAEGESSAGGAGIWNTGTLTVADTTIANNTAPDGSGSPGATSGGGLGNDGGTATVTGSILTGNSASSGGGIYSTGPLTVTACLISGNNASSVSGGGIYASGTARISRSTVTGNAAGSGGGIYFSRGTPGTLTLEDSTVANNWVSSSTGNGAGGGITSRTWARPSRSRIPPLLPTPPSALPLRRAAGKEPERRLQSADEVIKALRGHAAPPAGAWGTQSKASPGSRRGERLGRGGGGCSRPDHSALA